MQVENRKKILKGVGLFLVVGIILGVILKVLDDNSKLSIYSDNDLPENNAIYYWKTTFQLTEYERQFLRVHHIGKMYVRMFDVDYGEDKDGILKSIPIATTRFLDTIPAGVEVIPTVYITTEAIKKDSSFASLLYNRIRAMVKQNKLGKIKEIQVDCDWTRETQPLFFSFCEELRDYAAEEGIKLSATIRLHQLEKEAPPVDKGVLMLYNTGSIYHPDTKNSIISYKDVVPYLRSEVEYPLPFDYAFPTYAWSILLRRNEFQSILRTTDFKDATYCKKLEDNQYEIVEPCLVENVRLWKGDIIRIESSPIEEILKVKKLVRSKIRQHAYHTVIYHLDAKNLSKYTRKEIGLIYKND